VTERGLAKTTHVYFNTLEVTDPRPKILIRGAYAPHKQKSFLIIARKGKVKRRKLK
jgi:hypothetical protein